MEKLSVVIATINDSIATALTISQIIFQLEDDGIDYEIILVDNGNEPIEEDNLNDFLRFHKEFPIYYYHYRDIRGYIPSHAYGVTKANGKYIIMPDPHSVFSAHYFRNMLNKFKELKDVGILFSPFSVGCLTKKGGDYIGGNRNIPDNPFGRGAIGGGCKRTDKVYPVFTDALPYALFEKEWFMFIGNMFPDAFRIAGGHTVESVLVGALTWMFGKKCYVYPEPVAEHPVYRKGHGAGRSANMSLSMATGAYIVGGDEYLSTMTGQYGTYGVGQLEEIPLLSQEAREYVLANSEYTLNELKTKWEEIKNA